MTVDQIEWLINQRKKSDQLRTQLLGEADRHFHSQCLRDKAELPPPVVIKNHGVRIAGCLTMVFCPAFPKEPFCTPPELREIARKIAVDDYLTKSPGGFPIYEGQWGTIVRAGLIHSFIKGNHVFFSELNTFGLYFYRQKLRQKVSRDGENVDTFITTDLFARFDQFCDSAHLFYREIGYYGPLQFKMHLTDLSRIRLKPYPEGLYDEEFLTSLDESIDHEETLNFGLLTENKDKLILSWMQKISWAYGWDIQENEILGWYNRHRVTPLEQGDPHSKTP